MDGWMVRRYRDCNEAKLEWMERGLRQRKRGMERAFSRMIYPRIRSSLRKEIKRVCLLFYRNWRRLELAELRSWVFPL